MPIDHVTIDHVTIDLTAIDLTAIDLTTAEQILFDPRYAYIPAPPHRIPVPMYRLLQSALIFVVFVLFSPEDSVSDIRFPYPATLTSAREVNGDVSEDAPDFVYSAPSDTVDAGRLYVVNLPDSVSGIPVHEYAARLLPVRSWLLNKSFFWRTSENDRGDHAFTFLVFLEGGTQAPESLPSDSVIVKVTVR